MKLRILVACEFSGVVRDAFRRQGHEAWSCDLLPAEDNSEYHLQCDVLDVVGGLLDKEYSLTQKRNWDMMIAHPPCTYLCSMGIWWNHKRPERWPMTQGALEFVKAIWAAPIPLVALENPIGYLSNNWMRPTQVIHPWQFGHEASKPTCLWLRGLPRLKETKVVGKGRFYVKANGTRMAAWSHVTSGTNKAKRAAIASRTFEGIAQAMADQWGG